MGVFRPVSGKRRLRRRWSQIGRLEPWRGTGEREERGGDVARDLGPEREERTDGVSYRV